MLAAELRIAYIGCAGIGVITAHGCSGDTSQLGAARLGAIAQVAIAADSIDRRVYAASVCRVTRVGGAGEFVSTIFSNSCTDPALVDVVGSAQVPVVAWCSVGLR